MQRPAAPHDPQQQEQPGSAISDLGPTSVKEPTSDSPTTKAELVRKQDHEVSNYKRNMKTHHKEMAKKLSKSDLKAKIQKEESTRQKNHLERQKKKGDNNKDDQEDAQQLEANRN